MKKSLQLALAFIFSMTSHRIFASDKNPSGNLPQTSTNDIKMLSTFLYTASGNIADGNRVVFDSQYSNAVDGNDAVKLMNPGENFGLLRNHTVLAVEARQPMTGGDTLFYNMSHLAAQLYHLDIVPQNLGGANLRCELVDRFLNTRNNISFRDSNHLTFQITADPASRATNRLIVVFTATLLPAMPFEFAGISAVNNNNDFISLNWKVSSEAGIAQYEIERSADNIHFSNLAVKVPQYQDQDGGEYQYRDAQPLQANNYYRIKCLNKAGKAVYSDEVKVSFSQTKTGMNVYPNPVINHSFQLKLSGLMPGRYFIKISNNSGQQVYTTALNITGNSFLQTINLASYIDKGNYNVSIWSGNGIVNTQKIEIQ